MNQDRSQRRKEQRQIQKRFKQSVEDEEIERLASEVPPALLTRNSVTDPAFLCENPAATSVQAGTFEESTKHSSSDDVYVEVCDSEQDQGNLPEDENIDFYQRFPCGVEGEPTTDYESETSSDSSSDECDQSDELPDLAELHQLLEEIKEDEEKPDAELSRKIAAWTLNHNVTHSHVDDLLCILRSEGHPHLKKNIKTILKTPRKVKDLIRPLGRGFFYYRGLLQALLPFLCDGLCETQRVIEIDVFVDGLSPYKTVKKSVWPIVGSIVGSEYPCLFVVALWCGVAKDPGNIKEFLKDFVQEAQKMIEGFSWNGKELKLKIRYYIGDAPARSFLRSVLVHNSYDSCERCTSHGQWQGRVIFPYNADAEPRTDATFASRDHPGYHTGDSPLEDLGTGMVSQFPLDGMHLIYLGVMKRLFMMLLKEKKASIHKVSDQKKSELSSLIKSYAPYCPSEFSRKPRSISEWKYYRAHELRRILLYDGVLLYNALPSNINNNFLLLHCAVRILSDEKMKAYFEDADYLLKKFVENSGSTDLYGPSFRVYNVHHLTHFADECIRCGTIEEFSAFKYENFIGCLKPLLKAPGRTLSQLTARIIEKARLLPQAKPQMQINNQLSRPHQSGPLCGLVGQQYKKLLVQGVQFRLYLNDSCCILKNGEIVVIENIVQTSDEEIWIVGKPYFVKEDMYTYPIASSLLRIFKVSQPLTSSKYKIVEIEQKCMRLPIFMNQVETESFLVMPMLQHFEFDEPC